MKIMKLALPLMLSLGFATSAHAVVLGGATCQAENIYGACVGIGLGADAGYRGIAIGQQAMANGALGDSIAIGNFSESRGLYSIALGHGAQSNYWGSVSIGAYSVTDREGQVSVGSAGNERVISNVAAGTQAHDAVIYQQVVPAISGIVSGLGGGATYDPATGVMTAPSYVLSMGTFDDVGSALTALDNKPSGGGTDALFAAQGDRVNMPASATGIRSLAAGEAALATGEDATSLGAHSASTFTGGTAVGAYARAEAYCTSLGYGAECTEHFTASFGRVGEEVRLVNVAPGINSTDAANMGQVQASAAAYGGGAGFNNGVFTPPSYLFLSGATYNNAGDALADLDRRVYDLEQQPPSVPGTPGPQGPIGETGADGRSAYEVAVDDGFVGTQTEWLESLQGADGQDGRDGTGGSNVAAGENIEVETNEDGTQTVSLADNIALSDEGSLTVGGTTVNADGVSIEGGPSMTRQGIDAGGQRITSVSAGRIEQGSTDAVNGGQIWALQDQWDDRWTETNNRITETNDRIDGLGAQMGAMTNMAAAPGEGWGVGVGHSGGKTALAIGWGRQINKRVGVHFGASFGGGNKPVVGFGMRFNSR